MPTTRCVFFDRDGVANAAPGPGRYVTRPEEFHILPGFLAALRVAVRRGYRAAVVTNQRCVALGLISPAALDDLHRRLRDAVSAAGVPDLLEIAVCPHDRGVCSCRKPQPGLLLEVARRHGLDLPASWMIGDAETDVEAGRRAGCRTLRVCADSEPTAADWRAATMEAVPALLERVLEPVPPTEEKPPDEHAV